MKTLQKKKKEKKASYFLFSDLWKRDRVLEAYSEPCETSKRELYAKTIFSKISFLDAFKCTSVFNYLKVQVHFAKTIAM